MHETPLVNPATMTAAIAATGIVVIDAFVAPGRPLGALYVLPLLIGSLKAPRRFPMVAAAAGSLLGFAGWWMGGAAPTALPERLVAIGLIWIAAVVVEQLRRATIALREETRDLADIDFALDQSAIVATTDTRGAITYVNQKFCEISKYSREELLGQDHRILNSGYHPKEFIRDLWVTIARGQTWRGEIRNRAKDGTHYWVDTTIVPFLDARRKPYKYMAIRYEITARKRSEERLREQESLARLGQMAAVVAHEVKNPIAGIRGALQVIGSRMPADSRDRPIIGDIVARLDALNAIVQDMLVFARPREPRCTAIALKPLLQNTLDLLRRDPALAAFRVEIRGPDAVVSGDSEQLQIVFTNVIMNAAHAMSGTGEVDVDIAETDGMWIVSIADRGPGMPADVVSRVFEPFFTTKTRGTGLGLPIARRIVELHHGSIAIDVPPRGGTVVSITLPPAIAV